ncbi:extracellular catalytic domain type 1 short-chain-length polyhydroxyalkanoate depolymerase [Nocardia stercoris]|uniref:Esterase n=1 Tax=Nocardia stercoris TaxID=2483361 RepID=A0A3M2LDZ9_9NOCA|nr:PHB depolymerase family esterase [Nocardia stercoris]RMI34833.1 hypothetical protein EBN03_00120 [Nocardia stercoris]
MSRSRRSLLITALAGLLVATATTAAADPPADQVVDDSFTANDTTYTFRAVVPATVSEHPAMVVVVHGCQTTAVQQEQSIELDPIARRDGFVVLYVDGSPLDTRQNRCWSGMLNPDGESRDSGDAAAVAGMTRLAADRYGVDPDRIYAVGMSSGAYETALLGGWFPDLYAAIGIHSGAPFAHGALGCLNLYLPTMSPEQLAAQAFSAQGANTRVLPVVDFQGDADTTVPQRCAQDTVEQWRLTDNLALAAHDDPDRIPALPADTHDGVADTPGGHPFTVSTWTLADRDCPVLQAWTIHGMDHFWSGGSPAPDAAPFTDPRGPNAAALAWDFFSRVQRTGDGYRCLPG